MDVERSPQASDLGGPVDRREFLAAMAAAAALAGATGCSPRPAPLVEIVPYVRKPEMLTPGLALHFATAMALGGAAVGLVVTSREGRPIKVEGNPTHPGSLGSTDLFAQASLLDLYDPDRSKAVAHRGAPRSWDEALTDLRRVVADQRQKHGAGLRVLSGNITSPTLAGRLELLLRDYPQAKWVQYEPIGPDAVEEGSRRAFGEVLHPVYDFTKADVVLALDADFLACSPGTVRYQRDFASRRRVRIKAQEGVRPENMSRLYAVESMLSATGAFADHRLPLRPSQIETFARALAAELNVAGAPTAGPIPDEARAWVAPLARDLAKHRGRCLVVVGDGQPTSLHALAHAVNAALGNVGQTVRFTAPLAPETGRGTAAFRTLINDMTAQRVELLLVIESNPAYTAPVDLDFAAAIKKVKLSAHLGLYADETAAVCDWHVPAVHYLESWGDVHAFDGTVTIQQPLILPLYGGQSAVEFLSEILGESRISSRDAVRQHWQQAHPGNDFEAYWERALKAGVVPNTALPTKSAKLRTNWATDSPVSPSESSTSWEIEIRADPTLFDGRFANNAWLQELPKPVTKLTWGNAAFLSPATAKALGVENEAEAPGGQHGHGEANVVVLRYRGRAVRAPAWIVPGHADNAITVHLGHGRPRAGGVGTDVGFNAYALRTSEAPNFGAGLEVVKTDDWATVACTQAHHQMNFREAVHHYKAHDIGPEMAHDEPALTKAIEKASVTALPSPDGGPRDPRLTPLTLYQQWPYPGHRWAMSIDLSTCTGCSACVVACQAENNVPVVGKKEVVRGREMHWIRIDQYTVGDPAQPMELRHFFQPVPCMQCENAPCELVCPVDATVHNEEGLNDMTYNRCVGTRYCSNNCPYKVRRFNFLAYVDFATESLKLGRNPEVTVRSRGVMEKCTYCVQRIRNGEIQAQIQGKPALTAAIQTACQQACPSRAIVFGDLSDSASEVVRWKAEPHDYGLLAELNTRPRTTYLAAVRNPNPDMPEGA